MPSQIRAVVLALAVCFLAPPLALAESPQGSRTYKLYDGSTATVGPDGFGWRTDKTGKNTRPFIVTLPGGKFNDISIIKQLSLPRRGSAAGRVLVTLEPGAQAPGGARPLPGAERTFVLDVRDNPARAAARLRATKGVTYAAPDSYVSAMSTDPVELPEPVRKAMRSAPTGRAPIAQGPGIPSNYGLQSSLQAHLNSSGVDAVGAFVELAQRFGQLPGQGIRITNVSIGDLTDQSMADNGDWWVQYFGPTTIVSNGQRYLDVPALPLIPTYVVSPDGTVDPLGTAEQMDPYLGEVLLDFSVMAPLPHDRQRPEAMGDGPTDLLGIAPGADYRLVVPKEPTVSNIFVALLAAAQQTPRPDVITASLGFGFDGAGFPGRYLEEDAVGQKIIETIVQKYGIVVCISANDGTRTYTPAAIGPDGGSAPTELADARHPPTDVNDVGLTTVPSYVKDSGAIDVGGTTLDDISSAPPHYGGPLSRVLAFPTTRFNGSGGFSSGFGSRVNISAPSDGIVALMHLCTSWGRCTAQDVIPVLSGGTSASAPMTAAAAAVVLQVSRLLHRNLSAVEVRDLLVRTARPVQDAPQSDRPIHVGPALDVTAAVEALLPRRGEGLSIARLAVAHRRPLGDLGGLFVEATDPQDIDLAGPYDGLIGNGQNVTGPITFAPDVLGGRSADDQDDDTTYALLIDGRAITSRTPAIRVLPAEIAALAGTPLASDEPRSIGVTYQILRGRRVVASASRLLTLGPTDGTYVEPLAPIAPARAEAGEDVVVQVDVSNVRGLKNPSLFVSSINHWSPSAAPIFRQETSIPLGALAGQVVIPASAFKAGAGVYGIGIRPNSDEPFVGEVAVVRIAQESLVRAGPPLISGGHSAVISRSTPKFTVRWDVTRVSGADGAVLEFSAPGPTLRNSYNTFTNANGDRRDDDGVETASALWLPLGATAGTRELDAVALKLPSSLFYGVRVLATSQGNVIGEASAAAALEFDDGLTPAGTAIVDFDIGRDGASAALFDWSDPVGVSSIVPYVPATGAFGSPIVEDRTAQVMYRVLGSDPSLHTVLALGQPWNGWQESLLTFDARSGAPIASLDLDLAASPYLSMGRVDPVRHRAALLGSDWNAGDQVMPFDLASGTAGAPVPVDAGSGKWIYDTLDIDQRTGRVFMATAMIGDRCIMFPTQFGALDMDTGIATAPVETFSCSTGIAASQDGGAVYLTKGPLFSWPHLLPVARLQSVDQNSLSVGDLQTLHARSPLFPAVDPVNHLLLVAFVATDDFYANNNAMSAVGAFDTRTGERVFYSPSFNFAMTVFSGEVPYLQGVRGIQLDPASRTAWTYGPGGQQIQQFSY